MTAAATQAACEEMARRNRARLRAFLMSQLRELGGPGITGPVQVGSQWTDAGPGIRLRIVRHGNVSEPGAAWIEVETP